MGLHCETADSVGGLRGGVLQAVDVIVAVEIGGSWQPTHRILQRDLGAPPADRPSFHPPVLVISEEAEQDERADALASPTSGVLDWVDTACPDREIAARLRRLADLHRLELQCDELARRCAAMEDVDHLTGLMNHRTLHEALGREFRRAERYGSSLSLILLDIDRFRSFNDTHGHERGDHLLQTIARSFESVIRETDLAARYGGDEFALLLPETDALAAAAIADRLRATVESAGAALLSSTLTEDDSPRVTASVGVASFPSEATATRLSLLSRAETVLRRAKDEGRNRSLSHLPEPGGGREEGTGRAVETDTPRGWSD
jgi:two-component system cell cycle response regulator